MLDINANMCLRSVKSWPNGLKTGRKEAFFTWCGDAAVITYPTGQDVISLSVCVCVCVCDVFPGLSLNLFPG